MNELTPKPNNLPENPKLSVCMIVRDEEKNLPRCLKSVERVADELVIVDTGSKDNTLIIARDFGAKVFHFEWCDDFSAARNVSLKHAHGDWILSLDADEELVESSVAQLKKAIKNPWCLLYETIWDNGLNAPNRFYTVHRLYRNHPEIKYERAYHETVAISVKRIIDAEPSWKELRDDEIVIRHYGYDESHMKERDKVNREIRIMEAYLKQVPDDTYTLTKLGTCYADQGQFAEAISVSNRVLSINPNNAFAHFNLGTVYRKKGRFDEAISEYKVALALDPELIGAHSGLGDIYGRKRMFDESIREYKNVLSKIRYPTSRSHYNLGVGYHNAGRLKEAISEYKRALEIDPHDAMVHYNTAVACFMDGQFTLAVMHCDKATELGIKPDPKFLEAIKAYR
jgi:glycosyltransferase involved in cell wall biosynthesis